MSYSTYLSWLVLLLLSTIYSGASADSSAAQFIEFDDRPLNEDIVLPDWFKLSFLELNNDIEEVKESGKRGLIVYFGQKFCPYCKVHLRKNWEDRGIVQYTQKNFEVVAIDVLGQRPVISPAGKAFKSEKYFSEVQKAQFTPSLIFYNTEGDEVVRLSGYHPPYQFRAVLEFVADEHYKKESLGDYLARGQELSAYEESELNESPIFSSAPYSLRRNLLAASTPLAVFFEEPTCHACNVLHNDPLQNKDIIANLKKMEAIQLDMKSDTVVITPSGEPTTARQWAKKLQLYYAPTIIFFDETGQEILRIDSVIRFYRLNNVLIYILSKAYLDYPSFQIWRQKTGR
ncbi:MAG: thioredoxin family protein [Thiohalomonadales bacterium]